MKQYIWTSVGILFLAVFFNQGECKSISKRQIHLEPSLDPALQEVSYQSDDRDKRKIGEHAVQAKFHVKNALLGFLFHPSNTVSTSWQSKPTTTTTKRPTTTEDAVIFEKNKPVSLQVPDRLFGSTFTLITRLSTTAGDYMINSALRLQRLLEVFRPAIQTLFGTKGFVIEATTDKPIFSDGSSTK